MLGGLSEAKALDADLVDGLGRVAVAWVWVPWATGWCRCGCRVDGSRVDGRRSGSTVAWDPDGCGLGVTPWELPSGDSGGASKGGGEEGELHCVCEGISDLQDQGCFEMGGKK
jgi:hypothetical protein